MLTSDDNVCLQSPLLTDILVDEQVRAICMRHRHYMVYAHSTQLRITYAYEHAYNTWL